MSRLASGQLGVAVAKAREDACFPRKFRGMLALLDGGNFPPVKKLVIAAFGSLAVLAAVMNVKVGETSAAEAPGQVVPNTNAPAEAFSDAPPHAKLDVLFIHHSVGGRLLADAGPKQQSAEEIWNSHPEGGGLRRALREQGYVVHEASYGSALGENTDTGDWAVKFRDKMDSALACELNDKRLPDGERNRIVVFKSCFPNNQISSEAELEQAKQSLSALLPSFEKHPDTLFVYMTTPPLAPKVESEPLWKWAARALLGKPQPGKRLIASGPYARRLNTWVTSPDGWLKQGTPKNLAVFDLYDVLTDHGKSNFLAYPTGDGFDSHPSRAGNERVTAEFVPFLNRAVRRAALSE